MRSKDEMNDDSQVFASSSKTAIIGNTDNCQLTFVFLFFVLSYSRYLIFLIESKVSKLIAWCLYGSNEIFVADLESKEEFVRLYGAGSHVRDWYPIITDRRQLYNS